MSKTLEKIRETSISNVAKEVNMEARIAEAAELLKLLRQPEVVEKIVSADPYHRSKPTYFLEEYTRDDTGAEVSLLLFKDYSYGGEEQEEQEDRVWGIFFRETMDIFLDSSFNKIIRKIMGSETKRLDFIKKEFPEYEWEQIGNQPSFHGSRDLTGSYVLAFTHGSHLEAIENAILGIIQPSSTE